MHFDETLPGPASAAAVKGGRRRRAKARSESATGAAAAPEPFGLRPRDPNYLSSLYFRDISGTDLLTAAEEQALARRVQAGDLAARAKMIRCNLRLVITIAHDYLNFGLPLQDLIAEGNIGLVKAVDRFDPDRGARLGTYAAFWIKQAIRRALTTQTRTIRLPTGVLQRRSLLRDATRRLEEELGRPPRDKELAAELGLTLPDLRKWRLAAQTQATSLDAPLGGEDERSLADVVPDDGALLPSAKLEQQGRTDLVLELLGTLDQREQRILKARFGLDGRGERTLHEIGEDFGVTRERIRQLEDVALRKLRRRMEAVESPPKPEES